MKMLLLPMLMLIGCASAPQKDVVIVSVDTITAPTVPVFKTFAVTSGMQEINDGDLKFQEFAAQVSAGLVQKGLQPANAKDADMLVYLSYEVGAPNVRTEFRNVPVFGNAFGTTSNVQNAWGQNIGTVRTQNLQPTAYKVQQSSHTTFTRKVQLHAYEAKKMNKKDYSEGMVWAINLASTGSSNDLRRVFPYMITVGAPYFGKTFDQAFTEEIELDDARVVRKPASN